MAAGGVLVGRGYVSIRPEFEGDWSRSVNARASTAGRSGAAAFGKAFSVGLKSIGVLAGVAISANLSSVAASAAALAPALTTAGAAAGALKLGLSGVGDAFKQAFADHTADANAAASATKAVESAQRGLAKAQQGLADARVQAAERIKQAQRSVADAEQNLARTVEESAQRQAEAQRQVQDAERNLRDAQRDALQAQQDLNGAREEASRALQDMNDRLAGSQLDEREATMRLTDAQKALAAARANPGTTPEQLAKLQLAYDRAALNLKEQQTETKRLSEDTKKANKAGVEGSDQVKRAKDRISEANRKVADGERTLADAQKNSRQTAVDNARSIADAQQQVADAQADVVKARKEGARQIRDAEQAVADAAQAVSDAQAAAAAQTSKFDQAMSKLAPNAQSFVRTIQGLAPAWNSMRLSVQNELFKGLDTTVTGLARTTLPTLKEQLTATAAVWNHIAKSAAAGIQEMAKSGVLKDMLKGANDNLRALQDTPKQILTAFGQLSVAAQPAFNGLLTQFAGAITSFTDGIAKSFENGGLKDAINTAFGILSQFGTLLGNALGFVSQLFKAASDAGGQIVGVLGSVFGELQKILAAPQMQATLRNLFASVAQVVGAILPVIGSVVQALMPLLAAIVPFVAQLAQVLGPVLQQMATTLGAALMPIIQALGPVLVTVGTAILQVVQAVMPLLQPIAMLIAEVVNALAPALKPIIAVVTGLVAVLVGPLTQVVTALTPVLVMIGQLITELFQALEPFLAPLLSAIGQIAGLLADVLSLALAAVMAALQPLIPAFVQIMKLLVQLAVQVLAALMPSLNQLIGASMQLFIAILPILPTLTQFVALVLTLAVKIFAALLPPLVQLAGFLVGALARSLAAVIGWIANLVGWVVDKMGPVFKWLGSLLSTVVNGIVRVFRWLYDVLLGHSIIPDIVNGTIGWFSSMWTHLKQIVTWIRDGITGRFRDLRSAASRTWSDFTGKVTSTASSAWKTIRQGFDGFATGMKGAFKGLRDGISRIWSGLKKATKDPINFVLNTVWNHGVVSAWKSIGKWIPDLPKLGTLPLLAQGGTLPVQPGVFNKPTAIVGEGNPRHPEYVIPTDPRYRSRALALYEAAGGQLLAGGGILGDVFGGIKHLGGKIGGLFKSATSFLSDPGKALDALLGKLIHPLNAIKSTGWGRLAIGLPKALFKGLKDLVGFGGGSGGPIGGVIPKGNRLAILKQALAAAHVPPPGVMAQWLAGLNTLITRESGWNPNAINRWDSNAKAGIPSQGLAQTIPPTFAHYVPKSLRSRGILDPVANVAAAIRYIVSRYGNITNVQQANANRPPAGYDAGGWLQPGVTTAVNATGKPEAVLTSAQWNAVMAGTSGPARFEGDLYLDSGEFLGRVRGEAQQVVSQNNRQIMTALSARPRR